MHVQSSSRSVNLLLLAPASPVHGKFYHKPIAVLVYTLYRTTAHYCNDYFLRTDRNACALGHGDTAASMSQGHAFSLFEESSQQSR